MNDIYEHKSTIVFVRTMMLKYFEKLKVGFGQNMFARSFFCSA